jgi:hypothetical protein
MKIGALLLIADGAILKFAVTSMSAASSCRPSVSSHPVVGPRGSGPWLHSGLSRSKDRATMAQPGCSPTGTRWSS